MFKTITPIDNTVYLERNYDSSRIDETISNSIKAQNEWSRINVKERVNLLQKFVQDFLSKEVSFNLLICPKALSLYFLYLSRLLLTLLSSSGSNPKLAGIG